MSAVDTEAARGEADTDPAEEGAVPTPRGLQGLVLAGKYKLAREIGRGGMGSVWRAEHLGWEAPVAVKLMTLPDTPLTRERFLREVRLSAALRSPHVVQVLDHGVDESTRSPFIVMELLEGENLAVRLRRLRTLSPGEVMTIMTHLGRALARAHESGIVHRDLKPDNVYLVSNGEEPITKVLDFGVAKGSHPASSEALDVRTGEGKTVGTPWYMSPEQLRGKGALDHRMDLWSLAVIACECLTGHRPFPARDFPELAILLCGDGPRPIPSELGIVPAGFDVWFAKATARSVDERFQSADELVEALRASCGSERRESVPPILGTPELSLDWNNLDSGSRPSMAPFSRTDAGAPPVARRRAVLLVASAVAVASLAAGAAVLVLATGTAPHPRGANPEVTTSKLGPARVVASAAAPTVAATNAVLERQGIGVGDGPSAEAADAPPPSHSVETPPSDKAPSTASAKRKRRKPQSHAAPAPTREVVTIEGDRIIRTEL